ncbi:MAG: hypothetical protein COB04_05690 [Gammaproteobacteria bacterium]|nr:MAG: hypothetical protein COB04_05690 [Gammaproteobacteria bacterium]
MSDFTNTLAELNRQVCEQMPMTNLAILRRSVAMLRKSGLVDRCLQVGETVPDFWFADRKDGEVGFHALLKNGPVVVSFFRGFWCPFCKAEFDAWKRLCGELAQHSAKLIAIAPELIESDCCEENFFAVADQGNLIAEKFGVVYSLSSQEKQLFASLGLKINELDQAQEWQLPLPCTYLVDTDSTVLKRYVAEDYKVRMDPEEIIIELRQLSNDRQTSHLE